MHSTRDVKVWEIFPRLRDVRKHQLFWFYQAAEVYAAMHILHLNLQEIITLNEKSTTKQYYDSLQIEVKKLYIYINIFVYDVNHL